MTLIRSLIEVFEVHRVFPSELLWSWKGEYPPPKRLGRSEEKERRARHPRRPPWPSFHCWSTNPSPPWKSKPHVLFHPQTPASSPESVPTRDVAAVATRCRCPSCDRRCFLPMSLLYPKLQQPRCARSHSLSDYSFHRPDRPLEFSSPKGAS